MSSDKARLSHDANQQYRTVVAQQGRVTLEADWNEAQQIASEEQQANLINIIGSSGTPDDGYRVLETGTTPTPSFDFSVQQGTMYVGGNRVVLPTEVKYSNQSEWLDRVEDPDWVDPSTLNKTQSQREFIYLLLREQEVSAVEDRTLLETALGGPDTTQRTRLVQRIVRSQTADNTCEIAFRTHWQTKGLTFDSKTMRLKSSATLQVKFLESATKLDSCDPEARGGYLGAENQLIRVQISSVDLEKKQYKLVWGFDNASFLYRVTVDKETRKILTLESPPVDDFHQPKTGQAVEVLRSAARLSNGELIASATGQVVTLSAPAPYNPDKQEITLPAALPDLYLNSSQTPRLFLRVWEEEITFTPNTPDTPVSLGKTGLQVTLRIPNGQSFQIGDYWLFAVRPMTPTAIYPKRYFDSPQLPEGPSLWVCPLAVISWEDKILKVLEDCRQHFVEITKRQTGGCCNVIIRPEDLRGKITLQKILDRFADRNRPNREHITICLMPGIYRLPTSLQLDSRHSNFTLEGCGDGAELQAKPGSEKNFLHGLIVLNRANYVTLRNLRFQLPIVPFAKANGQLTPFNGSPFDENFPKILQVSIGIRPLHCALLTVQNCLFRFEVQKTVNLFAAGIFAGSECWELQLIGNRFLRDEEYLLAQEKTPENERRFLFLVGYLLSPSLILIKEELKIVPSLLQDAVIRDNRFTGLTAAMLILADTGMVRLEANTVSQCISGFYLTPIELGEVLGVNIETAFLGLLYPLPDSFDVGNIAKKYENNIQNIPGIDRLSLSLHASANDIDTQILYLEGKELSGPGLVVAGNKRLNSDKPQERGKSDRLTTSSVLLTANKICNRMPQANREFSKTTVLISNVERCTITGNLILNEYPDGICLKIEQDNTLAIAITGNVFKGIPEPSLNTWESLNTVIS
jgi:hypothetical protein